MTFRRKSQRGNAMIEFALSCAVLVPVLAGAFQFGYTFYTYNMLNSAVANGGRYAMFRTYRTAAGSIDVTKVKSAIKNMTVYGTPTVSDDATPVVKGLTPGAIDVSFTLNAQQLPTAVTVKVTSFQVKAIFAKYTFIGKPKITVPYIGRYAPEESEP